jgi:hypothetical protein
MKKSDAGRVASIIISLQYGNANLAILTDWALFCDEMYMKRLLVILLQILSEIREQAP